MPSCITTGIASISLQYHIFHNLLDFLTRWTTSDYYLELISKLDTKRDILRGFIKVHILFHATQEPVYGLGLIEELALHGYHLSPGTLYPLLHSMQQDGYLVSQEEIVGGKIRRYYRSTELGQETLRDAQAKIKELVSEVLEPLPGG